MLCYCQWFSPRFPVSFVRRKSGSSISLLASDRTLRTRNMSNKEHIRDAVIGDVLIINALHNQAIAEGLQEWNKPLPVEHHDDLLSKMLARQYPCVIAEDCIGEVVAYALLSPAYWARHLICFGMID